VGDPTQFQVGDSVMVVGGSSESIRGAIIQITQNVPPPNNAASGGIEIFDEQSTFPISFGYETEGYFAIAPLEAGWSTGTNILAPDYGISLLGPEPLISYVWAADSTTNTTNESLFCTYNSSGTKTCWGNDRSGSPANNWWWFGSGAGDQTFITEDGRMGVGESPVTGVAGAFHGPVQTTQIIQAAAKNFAGTCSMSTATTCTFVVAASFTTSPVCITNVQGSTAIAGSCALSGSTVTITAASSNSQTWGAVLIGNPN
jgi:hypothetical protein